MNARPRIALLTVASLLAGAGTALASTQTIPGSQPNMTVYVGDTGRLQAVLPNQSQGMFYGPDNGPASNAFYLRMKSGPSAGTTYEGDDFTPVSNGPVTGNFTPQSPAQVETVYTSGKPGAPELRVRQTTLYVGYQRRFRVVYDVTNTTGSPLRFIAGTAADLYIGGDDDGVGIFIDGPNRFVGGTNAASLKAGGVQEATASQLPGEASATTVPRWASYEEGDYDDALDRLDDFDAFTNTIDTNLIDNGVGVSWDDRAATGLAPGQTARYEVSWHAERAVPLRASPAQAGRELPGTHDVVLSLTDANFNPVPNLPIRYRVDGVNAAPADPAQYVRAVTDAAGQVLVTITGTTPGQDTVLAFADVLGPENGVRESAEPQASARVTWLADNRVDGPPEAPSSLTGPRGTVPVGTTPNPDNPEAPTFTFGQSATAAAGFPTCTFDGRAGRRLNFPVSVDLQPGAGTIVSATLLVVDREQHDPNAGSGATAPPSLPSSSVAGNQYTFTVECVTVSDLWVRFTIEEGGATQTFVIPIGGLLLIDPQGVVHDRVAYEAQIAAGRTPDEARAASAITGATVRLQRRNADGAFANVFSGDPAIRPNVNPQVTAANGLFQWDVAEGTYRVLVVAPGFVDVVSRAVDVPPPVLDLHIPMDRPASGTPQGPPASAGVPAAVPAAPVLTKQQVLATRLEVTFLKAQLTKAKRKVKVSTRGVLSLGSVSCPKTAKQCAAATVSVRPVRRGKGKTRLPAVLVTRRVTLKPGARATLRLTLPKSTRTRVRQRRSVPVVVRVSGIGAKVKTLRVVLVRG